jgi:uncharacterized protein (DUF342 family)
MAEEVAVTDLSKLKEEISAAEQAYKDAKKQLAEKKAEDTEIVKEQFDASTEAIVNALNTLSEQLDVASTKGSLKAKQIVDGFGGATKFNDFIVNLAGYIGSAVATGGTVGAMPMIVMAGAARGVYKKVID